MAEFIFDNAVLIEAVDDVVGSVTVPDEILIAGKVVDIDGTPPELLTRTAELTGAIKLVTPVAV